MFSLFKMGQISEEQMLAFRRKPKKKAKKQGGKVYPDAQKLADVKFIIEKFI